MTMLNPIICRTAAWLGSEHATRGETRVPALRRGTASTLCIAVAAVGALRVEAALNELLSRPPESIGLAGMGLVRTVRGTTRGC